jgi:DnaJ-class molecular chaperone
VIERCCTDVRVICCRYCDGAGYLECDEWPLDHQCSTCRGTGREEIVMPLVTVEDLDFEDEEGALAR